MSGQLLACLLEMVHRVGCFGQASSTEELYRDTDWVDKKQIERWCPDQEIVLH